MTARPDPLAEAYADARDLRAQNAELKKQLAVATAAARLDHDRIRRMLVPHANGKGFAVIDTIDGEEVGKFNWLCKTPRERKTQYAATFVRRVTGHPRQRFLALHRLIAQLAGFGDAPQVDHRNGDGLDCRRLNLRPATGNQNASNTRRRKDNTSGFKGVWLESGRWRASVRFAGKRISLGYFATAEAAARAYDAAALKYHGQYAVLNLPRVEAAA